MQNDALRFCKGLSLLDRVSIQVLHDSIHLLSLEQHLLKLMYTQSKKNIARNVTNLNTRSQTKYVFKLDSTIGTKYGKSPYYLGTLLWNSLDRETQMSDSIYSFKKKIDKIYKKYNPLL